MFSTGASPRPTLTPNLMEQNFNETLSRYEQSLHKISLDEYFEANDLLDIIDYYIKNERYTDADQCLGFALAQYPDNEEVWITKAYRLKSEGRWNEARAIIDNLSDQECADARLFRIEEYIADGSWDRAFFLVERIMNDESLPNRIEMIVDIAEILIDYGLYTEANYFLKDIPDGHPEKPHALELMAECHFQNHDYDKAVEVSNKLIDLDPYNQRSWEQMANIRQMQGNFQEMRECADYALAINPKSDLAMRQRIIGLLCGEDLNDEIFSEAKKYNKQHREDLYVAMPLAQSLLDLEQPGDALPILKNALKLTPFDSPDRTVLLLMLGWTFCLIGDDDNAKQCALAISSFDASNLQQLKHTLEHINSFQKPGYGVELLDRVHDLMPANSELFNITVSFLAENKIYEEAFLLWHRCITQPEYITITATPGIARAVYEFVKDKEIFSYYFYLALHTHPDETLEYFRDVADCSNVEELIKALNDKIKKWKNK